MRNGDTGAAPARAAAARDAAGGRPPTAADVGKLARVSRSTVSLVLNQVPDSRVTQATRERVLAAAEQLGYVPHAAASALRGGHNRLVLMPFLNIPYDPALDTWYDQLTGRLTELGYVVMLHRARAASGFDLVRQWAALRPIGVIAESYRLDAQAKELLYKAGTRAIFTGETTITDRNDPQWIDPAGSRAAEHLIATGHRRLGVVVPAEGDATNLGLRRLSGAEQIARVHGVPLERIDLALDGQQASALAQRWQRHPHPTGIFAFDDEYALLLMSALQAAGIAIPGEVAIVGCGNLRLGELVRPRLTSIDVHPGAAGRSLADALHAMILDRPFQSPAPSKPTLIVRDSA